MKKVLITLLILFWFKTISVQAEINNTIAYSFSNTSSVTSNDFGRGINSDTTICQTVKATASESWDGVVIYLDREGLGSSTDSVMVRFRKNNGCGSPNPATGSLDRDVYVKVPDIPDGDAAANTMPPDSVARGYAVWFIFSSPVSVTADSCYCIMFNKPHTDGSNAINWFGGTNGYADGSNYYTYNEVGWTNYNSDLSFRVIKDKYSLIAIRRMPFNVRGIIAMHSSELNNSVTYADSLHRWLNTSQNVGGSWGQGLNIGFGEFGAPLWLGVGGVSQGIGGSKPYYFSTTDTTTPSSYKDSIDNYIDRRWITEFQPFVRCGDDNRNCIDSTHIDKMWNYMLNHSDKWGKTYKGGVWSHSTYRKWGIPNVAGDTAELGDSSGTIYHHTHKTFAAGKFKFIWTAIYKDDGGVDYQYIPPVNWQSLQDSLNVNALPFDRFTMRDGQRAYRFQVDGKSTAPHPDSLHKVLRRVIAQNVSDSLHLLFPHSHLNWYVSGDSGMDANDKDSLRYVADSASSWKLWMTSLKSALNQQSASAFSQVTVDRPGGSKRRINITSMYDWNWGSHIPDVEELRYLTFIAYAPESLIVTINASETLACSTMTSLQDVATAYNDVGASDAGLKAMSWVSMYNRTAGRKIIIGGAAWVDSLIQSITKVYTDSVSFKLRNVITSLYPAPCDSARLLIDTLQAFSGAWWKSTFTGSCDDTLRATGLSYSKKYYFKVFAFESAAVYRDTTALDSVTTTAGPSAPTRSKNWIVIIKKLLNL